MRGKLTLLAGVCAGAIAFPAYAQDAAEEGDEADIIVTATLRSENLQDVPLAVTAFTGATLEKAGVASIKNFEQVSASFNINSTQTESGGTTLRVRGVGTTGNNSGLESAVGIFLDGVYLSRPGVASTFSRSNCCAARKVRCLAATHRPARSASRPRSRA
jgi:iron complex outermembrane receptor protein